MGERNAQEHAASNEAKPFFIFRTSKKGFQRKVQAHHAWNGMERALTSAHSAGDAPGVHPVLRAQHAPLYHLFVQRQPGNGLL